MPSLSFVSLVISLLIICPGYAITETIMFHELFDGASDTGWKLNGDSRFPSTDSSCINASSCLELWDNGWAEKTWSFEGFYDIRIEISVIANVDGGPRFEYRYWTNTGDAEADLSYSTIAQVVTMHPINVPWDNKASVRVRFTVNGHWSEKIYISHLKIYGTPYSTGQPTVDPTEDPTTDPTTEPTSDPTKAPTANPAEDVTINPTTDPTAAPIANPTKSPTTDPTLNSIKSTMPYNTLTTRYTSTESKNSVTTSVPTSVNNVAPKTDTNSKQEQVIMLILIIIIGVVSGFTIIGCIVGIHLLCKNEKKNESHIRKDLSIGTGSEIANAFEIEMGNVSNKMGEAAINKFEAGNNSKYNDRISDSESNSDMYANNGNNMLQEMQTVQETAQTAELPPPFIAGSGGN